MKRNSDMTEKKKLNQKQLIRELADLLEETGLSEIEIEQKDLRVRVAKSETKVISSDAVVQAAPVATTQHVEPANPITSANPAGTVISPMVGTIYRAPEPGAAPFVEVGTTVTEGQSLLIVEAMKTMNHIPSPRSGVVKEILVEDAQPVEFGEPLMIIE